MRRSESASDGTSVLPAVRARQALLYAASAYDIEPWRRLGLSSASRMRLVVTRDAGGYVYRDAKGEMVIAFRGSRDCREWRSNLRFLNQKDPRIGSFHSGFLRSAQALSPSVRVALRDLSTSDEHSVTLIGHSRGGALAIIVGLLLQVAGVRVLRIVTFSTPSTGRFKREPPPLYRFENHTDLVPLLRGRRRYGQILYFDRCGRYRPGISRWDRAGDMLLGMIAHLGVPGLATVEDHSLREWSRVLGAVL